MVTGASSGIGRACAAEFARRGFRVVGTCRDPSRLAAADRLPGVDYQPLDLGDRASVAATADRVGPLGPVDILINNAGQSLMGPLEEVGIDVVERLFAVNVFGQIQLTQLLVPGMRAAGGGSVVMVGSLIAEFPLPFRSAYVASKAALGGFVLSARRELAPFGIRISLVEPGYVRTALTGNRPVEARGDSPYAGAFAAVRAAIARGDARGGSPEPVARRIAEIALATDPPPVRAAGRGAPALLAARRLMSHRLAERLIARSHGLTQR